MGFGVKKSRRKYGREIAKTSFFLIYVLREASSVDVNHKSWSVGHPVADHNLRTGVSKKTVTRTGVVLLLFFIALRVKKSPLPSCRLSIFIEFLRRGSNQPAPTPLAKTLT